MGDWSIGDGRKGRGGPAAPVLYLCLAQLEVGEQSSLSWTLIFSLYSAASTGRKRHELSSAIITPSCQLISTY